MADNSQPSNKPRRTIYDLQGPGAVVRLPGQEITYEERPAVTQADLDRVKKIKQMEGRGDAGPIKVMDLETKEVWSFAADFPVPSHAKYLVVKNPNKDPSEFPVRVRIISVNGEAR